MDFSTFGHYGFFQFLAIITKAVMKVLLQIFLYKYLGLKFSGYMLNIGLPL